MRVGEGARSDEEAQGWRSGPYSLKCMLLPRFAGNRLCFEGVRRFDTGMSFKTRQNFQWTSCAQLRTFGASSPPKDTIFVIRVINSA